METLRDNMLARLTLEDWHAIHRALRERYREFDQGNIVNISFGRRQCEDLKKERLEYCVRFLVLHKRTPRERSRRINSTIQVRLYRRRTKTYVQVELPTDVEEVSPIVPTGSFVNEVSSGQRTGSTGLIVRLKKNNIHTRGFVTVAHPYRRLSGCVDVVARRRGTVAKDVSGRICMRSKLTTLFDAAFAETSYKALSDGNYLIPDGGSKLTLAEFELKKLARTNAVGHILRPQPKGPAQVTIIDYIPKTLKPLPIFGHMRGLLRGKARQKKVFFVGTSGAIWRFDNQIASIQFAAEKNFRIGYSQAAFAILNEWLKPEFQANKLTIMNSF